MITEPEIVRISEQIERNLGLHFPKNRFEDLKLLILTALPDLGFDNNFNSFYQAISNNSFSPLQYDTLALHLTIGETYFFRESISLDALTKNILQPLIEERSKEKKEIRIWSAGCCSGEEAYTLAILLFELIPDIESWNITIIGTDINRNFIQKAIKGRYTKWSFRMTPTEMLNSYFTKVGKEFDVIPRIKKMVTFSYINLADDKYPSRSTNTDAMDIILCRNVLMYFSVVQREQVFHRFTKSLIHNGWLITSPVEVSNEAIPGLTRVNIDNAILYHKGIRIYEKKKNVFISHQEDASMLQAEKKSVSLLDNADISVLSKTNSKDSNLSQENKQSKELMNKVISERKTDFQKAENYYDQGLFKEALILFKKAHNQNSNDQKTMFFLAKTAANLGYHTEAMSWCEKLIANEKMNANFYYLLATILLEINDNTHAEQILKKVLYLDPDHILAHFSLANYDRKHGKIITANKHYKNTLALLESLDDDLVIPESGNITVGRMKEMVVQFR